MAIYHLHQSSINRGNGHSAFDAFAYQAREKVQNEYTGKIVNYSDKGESSYQLFALPEAADKEIFASPLDLIREMERVEESSTGCVGLIGDVALPKELTSKQQIELINLFAKTFTDQGQAVIINRHSGHDNDNDHFHYIATVRPLSEDGKRLSTSNKCFNEYEVTNGKERKFMSAAQLKENPDFQKIYKYRVDKKIEHLTQAQAKEIGLNPTKDRTSRAPVQRTVYVNEYLSRENLIERRKAWENCTNEILKKYKIEQTISSESYKTLGINKEPGIHLGSKLHRLQQKGIKTILSNRIDVVAKINEHLKSFRLYRKYSRLDRLENAIIAELSELHQNKNNLAQQITSLKGGVKSFLFKDKIMKLEKEMNAVLNLIEKKQEKRNEVQEKREKAENQIEQIEKKTGLSMLDEIKKLTDRNQRRQKQRTRSSIDFDR